MKRSIAVLMIVFIGALGFIICGMNAEAATTVKGTVKDASGQAIVGATVFLIPASDVAGLYRKPPFDIVRNSPNDEPFEDNLAANRDKYLKALTDKKGSFTIQKVPESKFFVYAEPSDAEHLPGGNISSKSMTTKELSAKPLKILVSGKVPANAHFVGSSQCLNCHKYDGLKKTLHKLGIAVIGKPSKLQDYSRFPKFNDGLNKLMAGTKFYFSGFDKSRGFDKYMISEKMPSDPAAVSFTATFFKDADGKLKFKTENMKDSADPARTYTVEMTYGGGLYKQRYLFRSGNFLFPFVQYNTMGDENLVDRARKPWRDYHADWLFNEDTKKLTDPPAKKAFEKECASCHFTGYSLTPTVGGDYVTGAANDPNGEADIDGDGIPNELNIGCEVCHGPGSEHVKSGKERKAATIVNPGNLAPERTTVICDQCHSRPQGYEKNDQPVNKENKMVMPGTSRNDYLVNHTTREDADVKDFWPDKIHSKSHHQQGTDLIRSKKYINGNMLLTCTDCHDQHGKSEVKHQLRKEVRDEKNTLCEGCHKDLSDVKKHTSATVGMAHAEIHCVDCHNPKTMQTGSGFGKGLSKKDGKNYWINDITSHIFDVPRKDNVGVKGVDPGKAMPIPYTNACGKCHNVDAL